MDIYDTENSRYEIDLPARRYRRSPLPHGMVHEDSPRLKYGEWLPLKDMPNPVNMVCVSDGFRAPERAEYALHIMHDTSTHGIMTSVVKHVSLGVDAGHDRV